MGSQHISSSLSVSVGNVQRCRQANGKVNDLMIMGQSECHRLQLVHRCLKVVIQNSITRCFGRTLKNLNINEENRSNLKSCVTVEVELFEARMSQFSVDNDARRNVLLSWFISRIDLNKDVYKVLCCFVSPGRASGEHCDLC